MFPTLSLPRQTQGEEARPTDSPPPAPGREEGGAPCSCLVPPLGMIHDYDHPGLNNNFHLKIQSYLATLYNDRSVLENHHLAEVFDLMKTPRSALGAGGIRVSAGINGRRPFATMATGRHAAGHSNGSQRAPVTAVSGYC